MPTPRIDPWLCTGAGVLTRMAPPNITETFTPPVTGTAKFSGNLVYGQPSSVASSAGAAWTLLTTSGTPPFPGGLGKYAKFYSAGNYMTAYNALNTGLTNAIAAGYGGLANETPLHPIFCAYDDSDAHSLYAQMHTDHPTWSYTMIGAQEADHEVKIARHFAATSTPGNVAVTPTTLATFYNSLGTQRAAAADPSKISIALSLTSYLQADFPFAGTAYTDFHTAFVAAGAPCDRISGDFYQAAGNNGQGHPTAWTAPFHMNWIQSAATLFGCNWSADEVGFTLSTVSGDTDSDTKMAARIQSFINVCIADTRCVSASYWFDFWQYGLYANTCQSDGTGSGCAAAMASVPLSLGTWQSAMAASS